MSTQNNTVSGQNSTSEGKPDPDIAGPGVVFGFIATGAITLIASWRVRLLRRKLRNTPPESTSINEISKKAVISETLVLGFSDQQLLTGFLVLVCAIAKHNEDEGRSLSTAADLAYFSSVTHATTMETLFDYFREHRKFGFVRLLISYLTFGMWFSSAYGSLVELSSETKGPVEKLLFAIEIIQVIGLGWLNVTMGIWTLVTDRALDTRIALSNGCDEDTAVVLDWVTMHQERFRAREFYCEAISHPLGWVVWFYDLYPEATPPWRLFLRIIAELLFPWKSPSVVLGVFWLVGLAVLVLDVRNSGLVSVWGFGQLLPALLVILPLVTLFESHLDTVDPEEEPVLGYEGYQMQTFDSGRPTSSTMMPGAHQVPNESTEQLVPRAHPHCSEYGRRY